MPDVSPPRTPPVEPTPVAELAGNLCWLLERTSHALLTELTAALQRVGISPRAHEVLIAAMAGERTQTELARTVGLDKTTMVVTLDELEAAGLAERRPSPADRRVRVIAVTAAGRRKAKQAAAVLDAVRADVLASLPAKQRATFVDALQTLATGRLSQPVASGQPVRRRARRR
jgi:DNA-binding MarR family transcriptional regulator